MCNLYSQTGTADAMRALVNAAVRLNRLCYPAIYPDQPAPILRRGADGVREVVTGRWGMPSPIFALAGKRTDRGVTNVRNTKSPHWRRWLDPAHRCLVPMTAFAEPTRDADARSQQVWFARAPDLPLMFFAGIWTRWRGIRRLAEGEVDADLFGFLTCPPNQEVGAVHPKAMPVLLQTSEECECWLAAPWEEAKTLQRPLPDGALVIVPAPA